MSLAAEPVALVIVSLVENTKTCTVHVIANWSNLSQNQTTCFHIQTNKCIGDDTESPRLPKSKLH